MFMEIVGTAQNGEPVTRSWHMIAEGDEGPFVPSIAAAAIMHDSLDRRTSSPGARACANDVELEDYENVFAQRGIATGVPNWAGRHGDRNQGFKWPCCAIDKKGSEHDAGGHRIDIALLHRARCLPNNRVLRRHARLRGELQQPEDKPFFAIVQRDGAMLFLKSGTAAPQPNHTRDPEMRWDAYCYTPDPDALDAEFAGRGASPSKPLKDTPDGLRGFEITDPDGYVLFFGRPREN